MSDIRIKHGAYAIKKPDRINRFASRIRKALIRDIGETEDNLSMQQVIIIDSVIDSLVVIRLMGEYVSIHGVMHGAQLLPCMQSSYLNYKNHVNKSLVILGIEKAKGDKLMTAAELAEDIMKDAEERKRNEKAKSD